MTRIREKGWWYPWIFIGFMGVVFLVNMLLLFLATSTWSGFSTDKYYEKGLAYNKALSGAKAQTDLGWQVELIFTPRLRPGEEAGHRGLLSASFLDSRGQPLEGLRVKAYLIRPTHEGFDFSVDLAEQGTGIYTATIALPLPGHWAARIHTHRGNDIFQMKQEIMVP